MQIRWMLLRLLTLGGLLLLQLSFLSPEHPHHPHFLAVLEYFGRHLGSLSGKEQSEDGDHRIENGAIGNGKVERITEKGKGKRERDKGDGGKSDGWKEEEEKKRRRRERMQQFKKMYTAT